MIRLAVTCDRDDCLAVCLEYDYAPTPTVFDDYVMHTLGWDYHPKGHSCPACTADRGPVLERGECQRCGGRTVDLPAGMTCHYCRHVAPYSTAD